MLSSVETRTHTQCAEGSALHVLGTLVEPAPTHLLACIMSLLPAVHSSLWYLVRVWLPLLSHETVGKLYSYSEPS